MPSSAKAYPGSCHCGQIQYLVKLTFPPSIPSSPTPGTEIYKCNCSTCHKMSFFHANPPNPAEDFLLLSPSDVSALGDYRCYERKHGWIFCRNCGIRVLGLGGRWAQTEVDVEEWKGSGKGSGEVKKVWKAEGIDKKDDFYLSINATTLEPGGEIDLVMWHDKGWVNYIEGRKERAEGEEEEWRVGKPFEGGMY